MALPIIGGLVAWVAAKITAKAVLIPTYILVTFLLITGHIAVLGFFLYAILFVYEKYNDLLQFALSMSTQTDVLALAFNFLQAVGLINAFNDVFSIFSVFIISYLSYLATLKIFHSLQATSNELFKIGVLIQQ